ncbi:MAG: hypothetical protein GY842_21530, partial [bacterium]|nr:hypothetical protein [bacterium]
MDGTKTTPDRAELSALRDADIREFLAKHGSDANNDLLADMITTICRMAK